jgi:DNA-directed RNA polymerase specialized sigma24 family protein
MTKKPDASEAVQEALIRVLAAAEQAPTRREIHAATQKLAAPSLPGTP